MEMMPASRQREEIMNCRVAVLMGGLSAEQDVSRRTGQAVLDALTSLGVDALAVEGDRDLAVRLAKVKPDLAFIALHGRFGEDGTVQGLLELMQIPYTGSGVLASSLAMNKLATKQMLLHHELPTPGFLSYRQGEDRESLKGRCRHFPLVVKPAREGSTIGITIVQDHQGLEAGITEALQHDDLVLIEDYIAGIEVTVGVLGEDPLPIIQIVPKSGFYDYQAKYTPGQTEYLLPAPIDSVLYQRLQEAAVASSRALGCRGAVRVDFMVREREFYCLEVNTIPGLTATSLLPKAAAEAGIEFAELVLDMLADAGLGK